MVLASYEYSCDAASYVSCGFYFLEGLFTAFYLGTFGPNEVLLRCWALSAVSSVRWDAELGPALAELDGKPPQELRLELCASDMRFTRPQARGHGKKASRFGSRV